jgi:hypothetical protein
MHDPRVSVPNFVRGCWDVTKSAALTLTLESDIPISGEMIGDLAEVVEACERFVQTHASEELT